MHLFRGGSSTPGQIKATCQLPSMCHVGVGDLELPRTGNRALTPFLSSGKGRFSEPSARTDRFLVTWLL